MGEHTGQVRKQWAGQLCQGDGGTMGLSSLGGGENVPSRRSEVVVHVGGLHPLTSCRFMGTVGNSLLNRHCWSNSCQFSVSWDSEEALRMRSAF